MINNDAMNEWSVDFKTHTRQEVLEVCDILSAGLSEDGRKKVIIVGDFESGKGAIVDALTAASSDGYDVHKLPETSLYENTYCEAQDGTLIREFQRGERGVKNSFLHRDLIVARTNPEDIEVLKEIADIPGIDFETYLDHFNPRDLDAVIPDEDCLSIGFRHVAAENQTGWGRRWSIAITDPKMQTDEMRVALDELRAYADHADRRIEQKPDMGTQPE